MSFQITTAMKVQFKENYDLLSQQTDCLLAKYCRQENISAEDLFIDQVGASDGHDIVDQHGDTQYADTPHQRRMIHPVPWEWADLIDKTDKMRTIADPSSAYLKVAVAARNRRKDKHFIDAAFADAAEGKKGESTVSFPAENVVAVNLGGSAEGLTINKLLAARKIIYGYEVDKTIPLHIALSVEQTNDLLKTTQVTSSDYNSVRALVRGEIDTFLGMQFHETERLNVDTNSYRRLIVWAEDGIAVGTIEDTDTYLDMLPGKRHSMQVRATCDLGASRMEEEKVVEIKCLEA